MATIDKFILPRGYHNSDTDDLTVMSSATTLEVSFNEGGNWASMVNNGSGMYFGSNWWQIRTPYDWATNGLSFTGNVWLRENASSPISKYKIKAHSTFDESPSGVTFITKQNGSNVDIIVQSRAGGDGSQNPNLTLNNNNSDYISPVAFSVAQWYFTNQAPSSSNYVFKVSGVTGLTESYDSSVFPVSQTDTPVITSSLNVNTTQVVGTAEANSGVKILSDGNQIAVGSANSSGVFTISIPAQTVGKVITAKATANGETESNASSPITVTAQAQTDTPVITSSIDVNTTLVTGTGEANATITILANGSQIANGATNGSGNFTITISPQSLGVNITAKATAAGEIESNASSPVSVMAQAQTAIPVITTSSIDVNTTLVTGTAEANATVKILSDGTQVGTGSATAGGTFAITIPVQTVGKVITAKATATNKTESNASTGKTVTALAQTGTPVITTSVIDVNTTSIAGTAEANATVKILSDGTQVGTGSATAGGTFAITIPVQTVGKVITAKATATNKTESNASTGKTVAALAQTGTPVITTSVIDVNTTSIAGTAEANATVKILSEGIQIGTGVATSVGVFTITIPEQKIGVVITAKATATNKTESNSSTEKTVTALNQTSLPVITNSVITTTTVTITGTAEANATVKVLSDTTEVGTGAATASGVFSITIPVQTAGKIITAKATTANKTESDATSGIAVTTQASNQTNAPVITTASINTDTVVIEGTAVVSTATTVRVYADGTEIGTGTADTTSGVFSITIPVQAAGKTITAKAQVAFKTLSAASNSVTVTAVIPVNIQPLISATPTISIAIGGTPALRVTDTNHVIEGTGVSGAEIFLFVDSVQINNLVAYPNTSGVWKIQIPTQKAGAVIGVRQKEAGKDLSILSNTIEVLAAKPEGEPMQPTMQKNAIKQALGLGAIGIFAVAGVVGLAQGKILRGTMLLFGALLAAVAYRADFKPANLKDALTLKKKTK